MMDREEWIKQTATLFVEKAQVSDEHAMDIAGSLFESYEDDILAGEYTPKDGFDDEIEEWRACC